MLYHDVHVHEVTKLSVWYCIIIIVDVRLYHDVYVHVHVCTLYTSLSG